MQQLSGTLLNLAVYLALVALGAFLGSRPAIQSRPMPWLGRFQTAALLILIVTLGAELGANDEIVTSLATIGLNALIITLTSMAGSLLAVHILRKYLLKLDAQGRSQNEAAQEETAQETSQVHVDHTLTILIVVTVVLGMLAGRFLLPAAVTAHCGAVINLGLYLLLFLVGLDMGRQGNMLRDIRAAGFRVFLVPLATAVGTLALTALVGFFLPMGVKDCAAAAAGFGWYSLSGILLTESFGPVIGSAAFFNDLARELIAIMLIPGLVRRSRSTALGLCGATSMDFTLPVLQRSGGLEMVPAAIVHGFILSLLVPILMAFFSA